MSGTVGFRSVGLIVAIALAGTVYTARPAHAGGDLGKVLAGVAVGYLVYKALDDDDPGPRHHQRCYKPPPPRHHPGRVFHKKWCPPRWGHKCDWRDQHKWGGKYDQRDQHRWDRDWNRDRDRDWNRDRDRDRDWDRDGDRDRDRDGGGGRH